MNTERWQRINDIFLAVCDESPEKRVTILDAMCEGDDELKSEVLALLHADVKDATLLDGEIQQSINHLFEELPELPAPEQIGPYKVVSELGRGGMGVVYRVERGDNEYKKSMALKLVKRGMDTDEILKRFRHERQILASLEHPNIARLYDGGATEDGRPYLVMEYVEGEPITQYCDNRRLTIDKRLKLFITVCKGVRFAHQNLIVHRDLKPSNVMVTNDGDVRLLDFGIAKLLQPSLDEEVPHTGPSMQLITRGYASPEQIDGGNITTASDVYSLGIILYELITGSHPYRGTDGKTLINRHTETHQIEAPLLRIGKAQTEENFNLRNTTKNALYRRVKNDLNNIVMTALDPDPQNRYQSAEQLLRDLERHIGGYPVSARPQTPAYRLKKLVIRNKIASAISAVFMITVVVFIILLSRQVKVTQNERDQAQKERDIARAVTGVFQEMFQTTNPFSQHSYNPDTLSVKQFVLLNKDQILSGFDDTPEVKSPLLTTYASVLNSLNETDEAISLLEEALQLSGMNASLSGNRPIILSGLAYAYGQKRNFEPAFAYINEAIEELRQKPYEYGKDLHKAIFQLSMLYSETGKNSEALELQLEVEEYFRLNGDTLSVEAGILFNSLAITWQRLSRYPESLSYYEKSLSTRLSNFGEEHPSVAQAYINMSSLLSHMEEYQRQETLLKKAIDILEGQLDESHPTRILAHRQLASNYRRTGRYDEAKEVFEYLIKILEIDAPPRPLSVAYHSYISLLIDMDILDEAENYALKNITLAEQITEDPFARPITKTSLADIHFRKGYYEQAGDLYSEVIREFETFLQDGHIRFAGPLMNLGETMYNLKRSEEAIIHWKRAFIIYENNFGHEHASTRRSASRLADYYEEIGNNELADRYRGISENIGETL